VPASERSDIDRESQRIRDSVAGRTVEQRRPTDDSEWV
jgi:hypothetical protein